MENTQEDLFLDIKHNPVTVGDFIVYPVNTFLRCGLVYKINSSLSLRAKYLLSYYRVMPDLTKVVAKTQEVHLHARSVMRIEPQELEQILGVDAPELLITYMTDREKLLKK